MHVKNGFSWIKNPLFSRIVQFKLYAFLLLPLAIAAWLAVLLFEPPTASDLSHGGPAEAQNLIAQWREGGVIVFVRHLERCSRVEAACLDGKAGITARAQSVGYGLGEEFRELGLDKTDIYNSPLTRTAQTAQLLFNQTSENQDWLYKCEETIFSEALERKTHGRNLILVTHSSCMDELEETFALAEVDFDYGSSLFISIGEQGDRRVLGFIDAPDWDLVFGS